MQHPSDKVRLTATIVLVVFALVTIIATPLIVKTILRSHRWSTRKI